MNRRIAVILLAFGVCLSLQAQMKDSTQLFCVMSYNVENFLDYRHDSIFGTSVASSDSLRHWNAAHYYAKRDNIVRVITALGGWNLPALVALCEVGNRRVLNDLVKYSGLKNAKYSVAHFESPDVRGIDVALLYRAQFFKPYIEKPVRVRFSDNPRRRTRDILYVGGVLPNKDTLHVFVCHFPSRLGGELESEAGRLDAAKTLRSQIDSITTLSARAKILVVGDFNDYPTNKSIRSVLGALPDDAKVPDGSLVNLCFSLNREAKMGSYKHAGEWGMLDQIIVSSPLLASNASLQLVGSRASVFDAPFLLEDDPSGFGKRPFRTYIGMKFHGGYSDHLPVYIRLLLRRP